MGGICNQITHQYYSYIRNINSTHNSERMVSHQHDSLHKNNPQHMQSTENLTVYRRELQRKGNGDGHTVSQQDVCYIPDPFLPNLQ